MARYPLLKELRRQGWTITHTRGGHLKGTHPDASGMLILPVSPSDPRSDANARAQARRLLRSAEAFIPREVEGAAEMNEQQQEQQKAVRVEEVPPKRATRVPGPPKGPGRRVTKAPLTIAREELITAAVVEGVWFRVELGTVEAGDAKSLDALRSALGAVARGLGLRRNDYRTVIRAGAVYLGPGRAKTKEESNEHH